MAKRQQRKTKPNRNVDEHMSYVIKITSWDSWWNFSVGDGSRWEPGPYNLSSTLTLQGEVYRPEDFKYPHAELTLSARDAMHKEAGKPLRIGGLDVNGETLRAYVFVPSETMAQLTVLVATGRLAIANVSGTRLRYRRGAVRGIGLHTEFNPDEW